jgi:hypothetical protein
VPRGTPKMVHPYLLQLSEHQKIVGIANFLIVGVT